MRRATFVTSATAAATVLSVPAATLAGEVATEQMRALETSSGGRLGLFALDTHTGRRLSRRADERFPMCSTFKFLAVAAVLSRVDAGREQLERQIPFGPRDLLAYAPVARKHAADGFLTIRALCEAAIVYSDNTAANLLLATIGGPPGVTRYARALGDTLTTLNRTEPTLNTAVPGDVRDTTTPVAMASDMRRILHANALAPASRDRLTAWLVACRTGAGCLRAGVPSSWRAGDKTGSGGPPNAFGASSTHNDIAVLRPPHRSPVIVTAYLTGSKLSAEASEAALAALGRVVSAVFA